MPMQEQRYRKGATIYREGDDSNAVHFITDGEVEVSREEDGVKVVLTTLRKGAIFGEMGVIRNKPRYTTTRALTAVSLLSVNRERFLDAFGEGNKIALPLLRMLCDRLQAADRKLVAGGQDARGAQVEDVGQIRLLPASRRLEQQIGVEGCVATTLPYVVGGQDLTGSPIRQRDDRLILLAKEPHQIAYRHFSIEEHRGRLTARDLGTLSGTMVNGHRIANYERSDRAPLPFGTSEIQTGGVDSPFRFSIVVTHMTI